MKPTMSQSTKWECQRCGNISKSRIQPEFCPECKQYGENWSVFRMVKELKDPLDTPVEEILRSDFLAIDGDETVVAAARLMQEKGARSLIVLAHGKPVGLITERDIIHRAVAESLPIASVTVRKIMSTPLITIPANATARTALRAMRRYKLRRLAVQKGSKIVGLVTSKHIVGDIYGKEMEAWEFEEPKTATVA